MKHVGTSLHRAAGALALVLAACGGGDDGDALVYGIDGPFPEPSLIPAITGARLASTNSGDDTLAFVDLATMRPIATIPVGIFPVEREGPHHLQASRDGRFLYVGISNVVPLSGMAAGPHGMHGTGTSDGYLLKIDATTGYEVARIRVSRSPGDVRFEPSGRRIWQSHFDLVAVYDGVKNDRPRSEWDSDLVATDPETMEKVASVRVCPAGHGIDFSADGSRAYVACWFSDQLAVVDLAALTVERVVLGRFAGAPPAPAYQPYAVAVEPITGRAWVSTTGPGHFGFEVYDPARGDVDPEASIRTEGVPQFGAFLRDGSRLFVATQRPDRLLVIDPAAKSVLEDHDLAALGCQNGHAVRLSPDELSLWIVCEGDHATKPGTLLAFDRATLALTASVALGIYPDDVALLPAPAGSAP